MKMGKCESIILLACIPPINFVSLSLLTFKVYMFLFEHCLLLQFVRQPQTAKSQIAPLKSSERSS